MQATSAVAIALVQSRLFGDDKGSAFNDVETGEWTIKCITWLIFEK
jgi:hypothetical protein